jgi:hypothetical protein
MVSIPPWAIIGMQNPSTSHTTYLTDRYASEELCPCYQVVAKGLETLGFTGGIQKAHACSAPWDKLTAEAGSLPVMQRHTMRLEDKCSVAADAKEKPCIACRYHVTHIAEILVPDQDHAWSCSCVSALSVCMVTGGAA